MSCGQEQVYAGLCTRRLAWFDALNADPANGVLAVIGHGSVDCPFPRPVLSGSVSTTGAVSFASARAATIVADCVARARARAATTRRPVALWLPFVLRNGGENHALAMHVRVPPPPSAPESSAAAGSRSSTAAAAVAVTVFEPHGSDPYDGGHAGGGFHRFYRAPTFSEALRELLARAVPGASVTLPRDWLPPAWGQSRSDVLRRGGGDRWCVMWTLAFLVFTTANDATPKGPAAFAAMVAAKETAGTLGGWVQHLLATSHRWMTSPLVPLPVGDGGAVVAAVPRSPSRPPLPPLAIGAPPAGSSPGRSAARSGAAAKPVPGTPPKSPAAAATAAAAAAAPVATVPATAGGKRPRGALSAAAEGDDDDAGDSEGGSAFVPVAGPPRVKRSSAAAGGKAPALRTRLAPALAAAEREGGNA